jgi:acetylornithine deacetylase/succinyl-diaminopimelate desuccinylase-like protein
MSAKEAAYYLEYFDKNREKLLEDFFTFLRFQSVSTDPEYTPQVTACAEWLADYVRASGMEAELWETPHHPIVFAEWKDSSRDLPTVLIYFHYDVQPIDPIEEWTSPPFEPTVRDGEIYARGAMDDKGQAFYVIAGIKAMLERDGKLPVNVKLCIEGEEECGSRGLRAILDEKSESLKAEHFFVVDLGLHSLKQPAVTLGTRGICSFTVKLTGSKTDLHSGTHGGAAYNPLHALVEILGKARDESGAITIPGFYDDILELSEEEREKLDISFDENDYKELFGGLPNGGEDGFNPMERTCIRPTLEINGIRGGYSGEGFKTVIPAKAIAKVSCRLVPNQDPEKIVELVSAFIRENTPEGMQVEIIGDGQGKGLRTPVNTAAVEAVAKAYEDVLGIPSSYILSGGSIPIAQKLAEVAGAHSVLFGYGLPGDCIHAPNEHFGIERIKFGLATVARALERLGN